jgi:Tat protein translocase TatB subunit
MFNIGPLELMVVFLIALVVVGPRKLPELGRTIGNGLREFRKAQDEVRKSLQLDELQDVRREITNARRGMSDALRFDVPSQRGSSLATDEADDGDGGGPSWAQDDSEEEDDSQAPDSYAGPDVSPGGADGPEAPEHP